MTTPTPAQIARLLGPGVRVDTVTRIEPWTVARVTLTGPSGHGTVVAKWLRDDPADHRRDPAQLRREAAALGFVGALDLELAPALLGAMVDGPHPLLVLEDLAPRRPVRDLILADGPTEELLTGYVRTLARLVGLTAPARADDWLTAARRHGVADAPPQPELAAWPEGVRAVAALGVELDAAESAELADSAAGYEGPGPFRAFSNGDAQHNNVLAAGGRGARLIDFENAGFQHALIDLLNLYLPGSMWLSVGAPDSTARLEDGYRRAVSPVIPELADDRRFAAELGGLAVLAAAARVAPLVRLDAKPAGDGGRLHRVATFEAAARVAERGRPALAGWCRRAADALRRRWPDTDVDLGALPPFSSR